MDQKVLDTLNEILVELKLIKEKMYDLEKPQKIHNEILSQLMRIESNTDR